MSKQIIKQPDGLYAVWSTVVDAFILIDATPEEIIADRVEEYRKRVIEEVMRVVGQLDRGEKPYYQFTKTFNEALEIHGKSLEEIRKECS